MQQRQYEARMVGYPRQSPWLTYLSRSTSATTVAPIEDEGHGGFQTNDEGRTAWEQSLSVLVVAKICIKAPRLLYESA